MKPPSRPKRWMKSENAIIGQLDDWDLRIWVYAENGGNLDTVERSVSEFLVELNKMEERGIDVASYCFRERAEKHLAYAYRAAGRHAEALAIFCKWRGLCPDNYHLVEDCVWTHLSMNDLDAATRLINEQPINLMASEAPESADHIIGWMDEHPMMALQIDPRIQQWARENRTGQQE